MEVKNTTKKVNNNQDIQMYVLEMTMFCFWLAKRDGRRLTKFSLSISILSIYM